MDTILVHNSSGNDHTEHLEMIFEKDQRSRSEAKAFEIWILQKTSQVSRTPDFRQGYIPFERKGCSDSWNGTSKRCNWNKTHTMINLLL